MFLILVHPMMRSDVGFIELSAGLVFQDSVTPLPEHAAVRVVNHATDEKRKKNKDEEKAKRRVKEEEEEGKGGDGSGSPVQ